MIATTEDSQLRSIEDTLLRRFGDRVPREKISAEFESSRQQFRDARIRTFVPVLILRDATTHLRHAQSGDRSHS